MTITLQDVQIILGLHVDGLPITGRVDQDYDALCLTQLGFPIPENNKTGGRIQIRQLSRWFPNLPNNAGDVEVQRYARANILQLLGRTLFADKSNNLVHIRICNFWRILRRQDNTVGVVQLWLAYIDNCVLQPTLMEQRLQVRSYYCNYGHGIGCLFLH
ncbi:hypothetical protein Scep_010609 [Stephania cephalantha]|uniref:Aminotransferase-like plant mobile domain-containing protein n=1 Tax=Stephania cephalantha TaxID=152367 RepID=A0AAP0JWP1_9MAGN